MPLMQTLENFFVEGIGIRMKTSSCRCSNRIFFNNYQCLSCGSEVGRCNVCRQSASFAKQDDGTWQCDFCEANVSPCCNRASSVCNAFVEVEGSLCQWCAFTTVTPDLHVPQNEKHWIELERAKRRLLLQLADLQLPPYLPNLNQTHPLSFQFLENKKLPDGTVEQIYTGHAEGVITVNIQEADSVYRESARVALREPQRTLIGHMRHEVGHYIDWSYARRVAAEEYHALFGDPDLVNYEESKNAFYANGAPATWAEHHVSAYATMHPWEDFAETMNAYLDIMAIAATANDRGLAKFDMSPTSPAQELVNGVLDIAITVSEFNFDLGLPPLLPERLSQAVIDKLAFIHTLRIAKVKAPWSSIAKTFSKRISSDASMD